MRAKLLTILIHLLLITASLMYLFSASHEHASAPPERKKVESSRRSQDDPDARIRYDIMRLRDPATNDVPSDMRNQELAFAAKLPTRDDAGVAGLLKARGAAVTQPLDWLHRGPANVGGRTRALAIDVSNENVILAGGVSGGMWRTTDGGATWTNTTSPSTLHSITTVAQDRRDGKTSTWYYGSGEYRGNSAAGNSGLFAGDGLFKSTDGGQTWSQLASTAVGSPQTFIDPWQFVWTVVTDPSNSEEDELYAATYGAIYRSVDGGVTWQAVLGGAFPWSAYTDVAITSTGVVYATLSTPNTGAEGSAAGIWRSENGVDWDNITPGDWPLTHRRIVIGIAPSNEDIVYFLAETPGSGATGHNLWRYQHIEVVEANVAAGDPSWENRTANLPLFGEPVGDYDSQFSYDMVVQVKPDDENVVFAGGTNLYRSTDGFASSENTAWIGGYGTANDISIYLNHHPDQHAIVFYPSDPAKMLSGHDGGVSRTDDNLAATVEWQSLNNGYITTQFYTIALDPGTPASALLIGGKQDNGTWGTDSDNPDEPWEMLDSGDGAYCAVADGGATIYTSSQNGYITRLLLDGDGSLTAWTRVDPMGGSGYLFINPFLLNPNNTDMMFVAAGMTIWRNNDLTGIPLFSNNPATQNWDHLTNTMVDGTTISALGISRANPASRLYYGTADGEVYRIDEANVGNPTPVDIWSGKGLPAGAFINCIAVDPLDGNHAFVVFSNYKVLSVFQTLDGGATWTAVSGNLEDAVDGSGSGPSTRWLSILPHTIASPPDSPALQNAQSAGTTLYLLATSTGIYSTTQIDGMATTWVQEGAQTIGNVVTDMLDVRYWDGSIVAGTHGQGAYSSQVEVLQALDTPELVAPANAATDQPVAVTLSWSGVDGATSYCVQVATSSDFAAPVVDVDGVTATSYLVNELQPGTTYYWRVKAKNSLLESAFAAAFSFTVVDPLATPALDEPADGATGVVLNPTLSWNSVAGASRYCLQVATDAAFTTLIVDDDGITSTSQQIGPLAAGTTYYWRVKAKNELIESDFSTTFSFAVVTPLETPVLDAPADGATGLGKNVTLSWGAVAGAATYCVQVATDAAFTELVIDEDGIAETSFAASGLAYGTTYYWRVKAKNAETEGAFSAARQFSTISPVLQVTAPNGGEQWDVDSEQKITWTAENVDQLNIEYSIDAGASWIFIDDNIDAADGSYGWTIPNTPSGECLVRLSWGSDPSVSDTSDAVFSIVQAQSDDWVLHHTGNSDLPENHIRAIAKDNSGTTWLGTKNSGLIKFDESTWQAFNTSNSGIPGNSILAVAIDGTGAVLAGTINEGVGAYDGLNWDVFNTQNSPLPHNRVWAFEIGGPSTVFIGTSGGLVVQTAASTTVYSTATSNIPDNKVQALLLAANGTLWVGTEKGLASFSGNSWTTYSTSNSGIISDNVLALAFDSNGHIWVGTSDGLSRFDGTTWTSYVATNSGLPANSVRAIRIDSQDNKWIATWGGGLARLTQQGVWTIFNSSNSPLLDNFLISLFIDANGFKCMGSENGGLAIYKGDAAGPISAVEDGPPFVALPLDFALNQNYPNPFNPSTRISFTLPERGHVSLTVHDVSGSIVATLVSEVRAAGTHAVTFQANDLPSGVYFYQLKTTGFAQTRKMLFVK